MLNLATLLDDSALRRPDREAVTFASFRLTYAQVAAMASQVASGLRAAGVGRGDKVALCCPNLPYFPIVTYGVLEAGATLVPLNVLLRKREMAYHLRDSDAVAFFCFEGTPELPLAQAGHAAFAEVDSCRHFYVMTAQPGAPSPIEGTQTLAGLMDGQPPRFATVDTGPDDTAVLLYTSGTTGQPKGAELTHSNLVMNAIVTRGLTEISHEDTVLAVLPMFHSFGHTVLMHTAILCGGRLVLLPRFEAEAVLRLLQDEEVTVFAGVPTMYWDLLSYPRADAFDLDKIARTLRVCCSGGAAMPVDVMKRFEERFNVPILEGYGLSETSPVASFNHLDRARKPGSIGQPVWGVEMRVVDDEMKPLPPGETGEIVIRGHNVMKGYYKREEATREAFAGGWFHTGDVGKTDEDGYFYVVDRTKDMIIRGGFNVYPREVEEVLMSHPEISLAAVIGVPDEEHGEEIRAYVIPEASSALTAEAVVAWAREELAAYKYPRQVVVRNELPMGPTGKILKTELRKLAADEG